MPSPIIPGSKYGDPRAGADDWPHHLPPSSLRQLGAYWDKMVGQEEARKDEVRTRLDAMMPRLFSTNGIAGAREELEREFGGMLPKGASFAPGAGASFAESKAMVRRAARAGGGATVDSRGMVHHANVNYMTALPGTPLNGLGGDSNGVVTAARPYAPEYDHPARQSYPVHRITANKYWKLFRKFDYVVAICCELLSDMLWSEYTLTGEGVDGEIKEHLDLMDETTQLLTKLRAMTDMWLTLGELGVHNFWNDAEGMWTHIALHDPDRLEVIAAPLVPMEPVVEFVPDDALRAVLTSTHPALQAIRASMPDELIAKLTSGQNIRLEPLNFTFLAKKLLDFDTRGTSHLARFWETWMFSDSVAAANIIVARRNAAPLKVVKHGDPATGWIPSPEQEQRFMMLAAQAEGDPASWISWNYAVNFEYVGVQDKVMTLNQHYDMFRSIKLEGFGISKGFISGEVTYAAASAGLTVLLQRLMSWRYYFTHAWLLPKYYKPVARMNRWIKPTQAELSHRVRTKRSSGDIERRLILPTVKFHKSLDPQIDSEKMQAYATIAQAFGTQPSKQTVYAAVNLDWREETKQKIEEVEEELKLAAEHPQAAALVGLGAVGAPGGGAGGGMPPLPAGDFGGFGGGEGEGAPPPDMGAPPGGAAPTPGAPPIPPASKGSPAKQPERGEQRMFATSNWEEDSVKALVEGLRGGQLDVSEGPWSELAQEQFVLDSIESGDPQLGWDAVKDWLVGRGYPAGSINELEDVLKVHHVIQGLSANARKAVVSRLAQVRVYNAKYGSKGFFAPDKT